MIYLKNNLFFLFLFLFISACQSTPVFKIKTYPKPHLSNLDDLHVISVKSNRIQQECFFFDAEAENKWRHQYYMYTLTDKNDVIPIVYSLNQDKASCYSLIHKVEKILKQDEEVRLCVRNELKTDPEQSETPTKIVQFGNWGTHKVLYESLTLDSLCNSKTCFSDNEAWTNTCPGFVKHD